MTALEASYAHCRRVARTRARNFYYAFVLLSREQRNAMCAVYAFMRYCDDLSDDPGANRAAIEQWRVALDEALAGRGGAHPVLPAFHDTVNRYRIPPRYFHEMVDGVASDLEPRRFENFEQLYRYCYQVASTAGLTTIHILGFDSPDALPLAEKCGIAFQLTNILRDLREDAVRDRIYLPAEDLARFRVTEDDIRAGVRTPEFIDLMDFEAGRARQYYKESQPLLGLVHRRSRASLGALIAIYSRLLDRIERSNYDVFTRRISLPAWEKCWIVLRALAR
ncbi:MAG TPA: phytoene/squalene synthase family protein [Bryobacteraceae bacterium]|jgi:15-cis-phytoene synthase|nr:phytoene/squalene synthase family protein [Bryobacteraceae bacterium]